MSRHKFPDEVYNPLSFSSSVSELVALCDDLGLVPANWYAFQFFQILENREFRRGRIECDLRAFSSRNHKRKFVQDVLAPQSNQLSLPFELQD